MSHFRPKRGTAAMGPCRRIEFASSPSRDEHVGMFGDGEPRAATVPPIDL